MFKANRHDYAAAVSRLKLIDMVQNARLLATRWAGERYGKIQLVKKDASFKSVLFYIFIFCWYPSSRSP